MYATVSGTVYMIFRKLPTEAMLSKDFSPSTLCICSLDRVCRVGGCFILLHSLLYPLQLPFLPKRTSRMGVLGDKKGDSPAKLS